MPVDNNPDLSLSATAAPSIDKVILDTVVPPTSKLDADQYIVNDLDGVTENLGGSGNLNYQILQSQLLADQKADTTAYSSNRNGGDIYEPASVQTSYIPAAAPDEVGLSPRGAPGTTNNEGYDAGGYQTASASQASASAPESLQPAGSPPSVQSSHLQTLDSGSTEMTTGSNTTTSSYNNTDSHDTTTIINTTNNTQNNTINNYYSETTINNGGNTTINYGDIVHNGDNNIINVGDITIGGGGGGNGGGGDVTTIIETVVNNTTTLVENVTHDVTEVVNNLGDTVVTIGGSVTDILGDTINIVNESILEPVVDIVQNITEDVVTPVLTDVTTIVTDILGNVGDGLGNTINVVNEGLLEPVVDIVDTVVHDVVAPVLTDVTTIVGDILQGGGGVDVLQPVIDTVGNVLEGLGEPAAGLQDITQPTIGAVTDILGDIVPPVIDTVETIVSDVLQPALDPVLDGVTSAIGGVPVVSDVVDHLINVDNLLSSPLIELGGAGAADHDIATAGDLNDITTSLLGDGGNILINGVEDLVGDIDLGLGLSQGLLGDGGAGVENAHDLSINLDINLLGHDLITDGIGINLDVVEHLLGDIDINIDLSANVLGNIADGLLDNVAGGGDTLLAPLGDVLSEVGNGVLSGLGIEDGQSLLLDNGIIQHLTDNLGAGDVGGAVETLVGDVGNTVGTVVDLLGGVDAGGILAGVTDPLADILGSGGLLGGDLTGGDILGSTAGVDNILTLLTNTVEDVTQTTGTLIDTVLSVGSIAEAPLSGLIETASGIADTPWIEPLTSGVTDIVTNPVETVATILSEPIAGVTGVLGSVVGGLTGSSSSGGSSSGGGGLLGGLGRGLFG